MLRRFPCSRSEHYHKGTLLFMRGQQGTTRRPVAWLLLKAPLHFALWTHTVKTLQSGRFLAPPIRWKESKMWSAKAGLSDGFPAIGRRTGVLPMKATVRRGGGAPPGEKKRPVRVLPFPGFPR